jgi:hypothetical protein
MTAILISLSTFPLALAILLHLALRSNRFTRRHALIGLPMVGFVLGGTGIYLASKGLISLVYLDYVCFLSNLHSIFAALMIAGQLFAITYIWTANAGHFWGTALLAGLLTMQIGSCGLFVIVAIAVAAGGIPRWSLEGINWSVPFFTVGALTHIFLRSHVPVDQPGYYRLSVGRVLLVLVIMPLPALFSFCTGMLAGPW